MLTITKRFTFAYAHHLPDYKGPCKNIHGHNAVLEIEVCQPPNWQTHKTGMVMDFKDLKELIQNNIISVLDHSYINTLPEVENDAAFNKMVSNPTAENMVRWIVRSLGQIFNNSYSVIRIRLYETEDSYVEWKRS